MESIAANLGRVREAIGQACRDCGRDPAEVQLVAVSKTFPPESVFEALQAGQEVFGENRVQEALQKVAHPLLANAKWHLIGHLQSNKANKAAEAFEMIETVDSAKLAAKLNAAASNRPKALAVLAQVNVGQEVQKSGVSRAEASDLVAFIDDQPNLALQGLMTIPPYSTDPEAARPHFKALRELLGRINQGRTKPLTQLSMGMSHDFHVAIQEGATIVRVGTAIFGSRG